jgi:hypothetical protein
MHGNIEICHERDAWRIGIQGQPLQQDRYRTLEEAIDTAWGLAARLRVAITVGQDRLVAA